MPNDEKVAAVAEITEHFSSASAAVITEYRGLTVKQVGDLRHALGRDTTYAVVKNTLTKRAAQAAGVTIADDLLVGPTAIAFVKGDPVVAAKGLRDFARTNPLLIIKGGVMDGKTLSAAEISKIADLESREVLLAKLAGLLKALPTRAGWAVPGSAVADGSPGPGAGRDQAAEATAAAETAPTAEAAESAEPVAEADTEVEAAVEAEGSTEEASAEEASTEEASAEPAE